jgi:hypothetical protein
VTQVSLGCRAQVLDRAIHSVHRSDVLHIQAPAADEVVQLSRDASSEGGTACGVDPKEVALKEKLVGREIGHQHALGVRRGACVDDADRGGAAADCLLPRDGFQIQHGRCRVLRIRAVDAARSIEHHLQVCFRSRGRDHGSSAGDVGAQAGDVVGVVVGEHDVADRPPRQRPLDQLDCSGGSGRAHRGIEYHDSFVGIDEHRAIASPQSFGEVHAFRKGHHARRGRGCTHRVADGMAE